MITGFAVAVLLFLTLVIGSALDGRDKPEKKPDEKSTAAAVLLCALLWAYALAVLIYCLRG